MGRTWSQEVLRGRAHPFVCLGGPTIKQAQLLNKDSAKLKCMMAAIFVLISTYYILKGLLIFVQLGDSGVVENLL